MAADLPLWGAVRAGERTVALPERSDAALYFLGRIRTPWTDPAACPKQGDREAGPACRIEIDPRWRPLLAGVERLPPTAGGLLAAPGATRSGGAKPAQRRRGA